MTNTIDYTSVEVPDDEPPENYHYTQRRAELLELIFRAGSPSRISQTELAKRYDVTQSQISQDIDALAEFIDETLGDRAKVTIQAAYRRILDDLLNEDDWRAKKAAWDIVRDWAELLFETGDLEREPRRSEFDVRSRHSEVAYTVVREGEDEPLPTTDDGAGGETVDYEALGFTSAPVTVDVETTGRVRGESDE